MRIHAIDGVLLLFNTVFTALYSKSLNQAFEKDKYSKEIEKRQQSIELYVDIVNSEAMEKTSCHHFNVINKYDKYIIAQSFGAVY